MSKVFQIITERIIQSIEKGIVPWNTPWITRPALNHESGRRYSGINVLLCAMYMEDYGYKNNRWITYKGIGRLGATIAAGEEKNYHQVVYWNFTQKCPNCKKWVRRNDSGKCPKCREELGYKRPGLMYHRVWNIDQTTIEYIPKKIEGATMLDDVDEAISPYLNNGPVVRHSSRPKACYIPKEDIVEIPEAPMFLGTIEYYSTLFHELGHSTGAETRLNREGIVNFDNFGSNQYAREELIADLSAVFIAAELGIEWDEKQHSSYLGHWVERMQEDPKYLFTAVGAAEQAAKMVLSK